MKTLMERASYLLDLANNSVTELAKIAGVKPPSVSDWLNGKTKSLKIEPATRIAKRFGLVPMWVATGQGPQFDVSPSSDTTSVVSLSYSAPEDDDIEIRQFDTGGSMGNGVLLRDQPGVIHSWHVTPEWVQKNIKHYSGVPNLCIVTGFGDSMRPLFQPGDPLLVDLGITMVDFDGIYFFRVGSEGFIKRLQRIPGEGIRAISENKAYESWTIREGMDFEVFGRVLKAWKSEDY